MLAITIQIMLWTFSIVASPFLVVVAICCVLAACGRKIGIRQWYINVLLRIFEYGANLKRRESDVAESSTDGDPSLTNLGDHSLIKRDLQLNADGTLNVDSTYVALVDAEQRNRLHANSEAGGAVQEAVQLPKSDSGTKLEAFKTEDADRRRRHFQLYDAMYFIRPGIEAIIEDEVTKRFAASELDSWNMLTRTSNLSYRFISLRLTLLWCLGFFVRWYILLPFRLAIMVTAILWIIVGSFMAAGLKDGPFKRRAAALVLISGMRLFARCFSAVIRFHNVENRPKSGFCVANHTSPIDVIILGCDNAYSMIGQRHGGLLGLLQWAFSRATRHIWFERSDEKDRFAVANLMRQHVKDPDNLPVLIFPEGTCINNTTVMLFRKGAFEIDADVYPAAIKYDSRFADPFWNSSIDGMLKHVLKILTSWAIVADVWYLPKQRRQPNEDTLEFVHRVRTMIARAGGLVELDWDGQLKRSKPRPELRQRPQQVYAHLLKTD